MVRGSSQDLSTCIFFRGQIPRSMHAALRVRYFELL